jgi:hypothetical protein
MLLLASSVCGLFKWRQFEPGVILLAVGWYLRFSLSYRDVEELLAERGLLADHVTGLEVGPAVRPRNSASIATAAATDQQQLASGRDLHLGQGQMGVFIPGCRFQRCDDRLSSLG